MIEYASAWIASFFYSISFLPQIYSIWWKQSPELNLSFIYIQLLGAVFMFFYGLINKLYPIIIFNALIWGCIILIIIGLLRNKTIPKF